MQINTNSGAPVVTLKQVESRAIFSALNSAKIIAGVYGLASTTGDAANRASDGLTKLIKELSLTDKD